MALWMIQGRVPVRFTVPMHSKDVECGEVECWLGLVVPPQIQNAVGELMQQHGRSFNGMWRLAACELPKIGLPVEEGRDPFECFSWDRPTGPARTYEDPGKEWDRKDFIDALYTRCLSEDRFKLEWYWTQFCQHALDWLINKERELDMGFCRIIPSPYRSDWLLTWTRRGMKPSKAFLDFDGTAGVCRRKLYVLERIAWGHAVRVAETFRLSCLGPDRYCQSIFDSMRRMRSAMIRLYGKFVMEAHHSRPRIFKGDGPGLHRLRETTWQKKGSFKRFKDNFWSSLRNRHQWNTDIRRGSAKAGGVPTLSDLLRRHENLRVPGRHLHHAGRNGRTIRVLVLPAAEGEASGDVLAVGQDGGRAGLAEGTERHGKP